MLRSVAFWTCVVAFLAAVGVGWMLELAFWRRETVRRHVAERLIVLGVIAVALLGMWVLGGSR